MSVFLTIWNIFLAGRGWIYIRFNITNKKICIFLCVVMLLSALFTYQAYAEVLYTLANVNTKLDSSYLDSDVEIFLRGLKDDGKSAVVLDFNTFAEIWVGDTSSNLYFNNSVSLSCVNGSKYDYTYSTGKVICVDSTHTQTYSPGSISYVLNAGNVADYIPLDFHPSTIDFLQSGAMSVLSAYPVVYLDKEIRLNIVDGFALGYIEIYEKSDTVHPYKIVSLMSLESTQIALGYIDIEIGNGDYVFNNKSTMDFSYLSDNDYLDVTYYPSYYYTSSGSTVLIDLSHYVDDEFMNVSVYGEYNAFNIIRHMKKDIVTGLSEIFTYEDIGSSGLNLEAGYKHYLEFNNNSQTSLNSYYYFQSDVVPEVPDIQIPVDSYEEEGFIGAIFSSYNDMIIGDDENYFTFTYDEFSTDDSFRFKTDEGSKFYIVEKRFNPIAGVFEVQKVRLSSNTESFSYLFDGLDGSDLVEIYQMVGRGTLMIPKDVNPENYTLVRGYTDFDLVANLNTDASYTGIVSEIINTEYSGDGTVYDVIEAINSGDSISVIDGDIGLVQAMENVSEIKSTSLTFLSMVMDFAYGIPSLGNVYTLILYGGVAVFFIKLIF